MNLYGYPIGWIRSTDPIFPEPPPDVDITPLGWSILTCAERANIWRVYQERTS